MSDGFFDRSFTENSRIRLPDSGAASIHRTIFTYSDSRFVDIFAKIVFILETPRVVSDLFEFVHPALGVEDGNALVLGKLLAQNANREIEKLDLIEILSDLSQSAHA